MTQDNQPVYLRHNVLAEPLFNQWYAWPYLISPATAAMYAANLHVKIMESFVASPHTHVTALKNPAMAGGPFIHYGAERAPDVRRLLERTVKAQAPLFEMAGAIRKLDALLAAEATGHSLEPLYPRVPDCLRGYVELTYDLNNQPGFRFFEGLLYRSRFYNPAAQSMALSLIKRDDRHFVFSTPRLEDPGCLHVARPFADPAYDRLYTMKDEARPLGEIAEALGVGGEQMETFAGFFTPNRHRPAENYDGDGVRVRYFGHACVLIETRDVNIMIDPLVSYACDSEVPRFTFADVPPRLDYVLITHNHQDHCLFETLIQLRPRIRNIVVPRSIGGTLADPSLKNILRQAGFANVTEVEEMESTEVPGGEIISLPFLGEHADLDIRSKTAHLVRLKGRAILCAADSNAIEPRLYDNLRDAVGEVDVLFLGMECVGGPLSWLYGPLLTRPLPRKMDQSRRFDGSDYARASALVSRLNPKQVYVYAMGHEPWLTFLTSINYTAESRQIIESDRLVAECRERGLASERLFGHKTILL